MITACADSSRGSLGSRPHAPTIPAMPPPRYNRAPRQPLQWAAYQARWRSTLCWATTVRGSPAPKTGWWSSRRAKASAAQGSLLGRGSRRRRIHGVGAARCGGVPSWNTSGTGAGIGSRMSPTGFLRHSCSRATSPGFMRWRRKASRAVSKAIQGSEKPAHRLTRSGSATPASFASRVSSTRQARRSGTAPTGSRRSTGPGSATAIGHARQPPRQTTRWRK